MSPMPSEAMSSSRPTNGLTYAAPTLAASSACVAEKISVTLTRRPSDDSAFVALTPSRVNGTLTTTCSSMRASSRPSAIMPAESVATTSALTGPCTSRQISRTMARGSSLSLARSDGLVVTPSMMPSGTSDWISRTLPESMKIFMGSVLPRHDRVRQGAHTLDVHGHLIAGHDRADARRRPCGNDIAGQQRHHRRDELDELRNREDELA